MTRLTICNTEIFGFKPLAIGFVAAVVRRLAVGPFFSVAHLRRQARPSADFMAGTAQVPAPKLAGHGAQLPRRSTATPPGTPAKS